MEKSIHEKSHNGYCSLCGKEKTLKKEYDNYNTITGEKVYSMECPDGDTIDCLHNHEYQTVKSFWKGDSVKCTKCHKYPSRVP